MSDRTLVLEIITPDGLALKESELDSIVFRRREPRFELGSEIAVFPLHAPLLVRLPVAPLRYRKHSTVFHVALAGGFAEVRNGRVLIVTPRCASIAPHEPRPAAAARGVCERWRAENADALDTRVGYPVNTT
jgi:F0F1-type ATP synthase epsilon subunit